eukprot:RCo016137
MPFQSPLHPSGLSEVHLGGLFCVAILVIAAAPIASLAGDFPGGGTSVCFISDNSTVVNTNFTALSGATNFSVEYWFYTRSSTFEPMSVTFATVENPETFMAVLEADFSIFAVTGFRGYINYPPPTAPGWRHFAWTVSPSAVTLYVDGVWAGTHTPPTPLKPLPAVMTLLLGGYLASFGENSVSLDSSLSLRGYMDELRLWNVTLTGDSVLQNLRLRIPEATPGLVVQWHFDDELDPDDGLTTVSAQGIPLALADAGNLDNGPCGAHSRPLHSAVAAPISHTEAPYLVVSYLPTSKVSLTLNCTLVVVTVPPCVQLWLDGGGGGSPQAIGVGQEVPQGATLVVYCSTGAATFQREEIVVNSTVGGVHTEGRIVLKRNSAPVAANFSKQFTMNTPTRFALPVSDPDGDMLQCTVVSLPLQGVLMQTGDASKVGYFYLLSPTSVTSAPSVVTNLGCGLIFQSTGYGWGHSYANFAFTVSEVPVFPADRTHDVAPALAQVSVSFVSHLPVLQNGSVPATHLHEDQDAVQFTIDPTDPDGGVTTVILGSLPSRGVLLRDGTPLTALLPAVHQAAVWVSEVLSFSSEYYSANGDYGAALVVGPQCVSTFGDDVRSWCSWGLTYASLEPQYTYTDFIVVKFPLKLYPQQLVLVENDGPRSLVRVRAPNPDPTGQPWLTLWMGSVTAADPNAPVARSIDLCGLPFAVDVLRLEFDCSVFRTYFELNAVELVGTTDGSTAYIGPPYTLEYRPDQLTWGTDLFNFTLSDCPGQFLRVSSPYTYTLNVSHVNHPPVATLPFPDVIANVTCPVRVRLSGTDVDSPTVPTILSWILRRAPHYGRVLGPAHTAMAVNTSVPMSSGLWYEVLPGVAELGQCGADFGDTFVVQLWDGEAGDEPSVVTVVALFCTTCPAPRVLDSYTGTCQACPHGLVYDGTIVGRCVPAEAVLWWFFPAILAPAGIAAVLLAGGVALLCRRRSQRRRVLHSVPQGELAFVFTDIQNSTHLWETYQDMPLALEVHHEVVRALIRRYEGYEVKTIGDSFFVAFPHPANAVRFALQLQVELM